MRVIVYQNRGRIVLIYFPLREDRISVPLSPFAVGQGGKENCYDIFNLRCLTTVIIMILLDYKQNNEFEIYKSNYNLL